MHLLAHITDCIIEHGPVYAFWLYAFERMNGILGSFPTSNHNISVQLMRKFITMQQVTLDQWPEELKSDFATLLDTEHGSLSETMQDSIKQNIKPLPPITEKALPDEEIAKIKSLMLTVYGGKNIQIARLCKSTAAVSFNESIKLAAKNSRYSHCSKVFIDSSLIEINFFIKCIIFVTDQSTNKCTRRTHWLANCTSYLEHPCQLWYGKPTEVWSNSLSSFDVNYFLISSITNRIVYVNAEVNFGRFMGTDNVLIVVPIPFD